MSKIEWTDRTWNPVTGCTKVSDGCTNCYAEGIARRFAGGKAFPNGFDVTLHHDRLDAPLRWRKPSRVFVNSMSDLFHDQVPDEYIAQVFVTMAATPQHTYQVLTKRHGRMRALVSSPEFRASVEDGIGARFEVDDRYRWPLPNVWLGVSVEDQKRADLRIPALLDTPAAVRFLSCEPLLGPVDLRPYLNHECDRHPRPDWVIVGGESEPGARPMHLDWARTLVQQCRDAGVPVFVKQLGSVHGRALGGGKGNDPDFWPDGLAVREWPAPAESAR